MSAELRKMVNERIDRHEAQFHMPEPPAWPIHEINDLNKLLANALTEFMLIHPTRTIASVAREAAKLLR